MDLEEYIDLKLNAGKEVVIRIRNGTFKVGDVEVECPQFIIDDKFLVEEGATEIFAGAWIEPEEIDEGGN